MKKVIFFLSLFNFFTLSLFSQSYKIIKKDFDIQQSDLKIIGKTKAYSIDQKVPFDTEKIFTSKEELEKYLENYKRNLINLRAFDSIEIIQELPTDLSTYKDKIIPVKIVVKLKDTIHLIAVPYPKYDSNTGFSFKLKAKDTNFIGSLNEMTSDLYVLIPSKEADNKKTEFGFKFDFDYPFKSGIFDTTFVNSYDISYTFGNSMPEWNMKTGLKFVLPFEKHSFQIEFYQSAFNNFDYKEFNDSIYFNEDVLFSVPMYILENSYLGKIKYSPFMEFYFNWDFDYINKNNSDLSSPVISIGHSIFAERIDWNKNFRDGICFDIKNMFDYNIQRNQIYPFISAEISAFKSFNLLDNNWFNKFGFTSNLYIFHYFIDTKNEYIDSDGKKIGSKLRGIRDEQFYKNTNVSATKNISALILNFDIPFHIFTTNFKKLSLFNFDLQFSPFIDIGLTYNKVTNRYFSFKDGFYSSGIEVLVYPKKFSSLTVRASLGIDCGMLLFKEYLDTSWRIQYSKYEFSFGVGLHY